ncbi:ubiquitin carboxyl-terminal hydrolase 22 isoform X3 [Tribolium castaneum]|uniref:ubiquitin carboxyl-terminal hydrolase 22 isoform X3 n=1 Tax=Tribolium castaneum TaxID=7070 RepID=UPI00046C3C63|nr:PREDICTED: ubiquitin carboxyl-terminal hydrolase 22 isoform X3 [Tribolium castaneum]|eukprot:XP_008197282.1 PREDICTED: ubiquitin carboxyl-terminal hydrolase 22 isoform X3 [Tribolium castaneum]
MGNKSHTKPRFSKKMSIVGCQHLQSYKKTSKNKNTFKWIHAVFVVNSTSKSLKTKLCNSRCRVCKKRGPFLHACLECVFFGCHKHIREHAKSQKHSMSMDLTYGQMHCNQCHDYIYDSEIDAIANDNKMKSKTCKKRLFEIDTWNPTSDERDYLRSKTKKICITPDSTIGLRGLLNLGQTCFMNCIVQALMHTPLLRDYFLTEEHNCKGMSGRCLVCEVSKLFQEFYNGTRVPLALHELLHLIWTHARHLAGYEQQDAHEFFIATLDVLHQHCLETMPDLKPVNVGKNSRCPCIIDQIFTGGLQSDVVCQKCKFGSGHGWRTATYLTCRLFREVHKGRTFRRKFENHVFELPIKAGIDETIDYEYASDCYQFSFKTLSAHERGKNPHEIQTKVTHFVADGEENLYYDFVS